MWKNLLRPAMIFIPLTLGMCFPELGRFNFLIRYLLMIMLFMVFLRLKLQDMRIKRSHFLILLVNLLIGISAYYLVWLLTADRNLAQGAFFVGITPTATAVAVVMGFLRGNVGYVITSFVVTNVGISLFLPGLLSWVCGQASWEFILHVAETLIWVMIVPYIAARVVRRIHSASEKWPQKFATATFGLWSVCLFVIAAAAADFLRQNPDLSRWIILEIALIALLICAVNFAVGYFLGEKGLRREASQSLGQKNTTLTIYLALLYAGPLAAMGVISYVLWHNSYNAVQLYIADRQSDRTTDQSK